MKNHETDNIEHGLALSRQFAKKQFQSSIAMIASAALACIVSAVAAPGINGLGLAMAAATGLSVGVWSQPNAYRRRNGSLGLAFAIIAGLWSVPVIVILATLLG